MLVFVSFCFLVGLSSALNNFTGRFYEMPYESVVSLGDNNHITIHIIPHTHDDVGWLETVDEYYLDQVQWILDTAIQCLKDNPKRKFTYVEVAYFYRWWREQTDEMKDSVRQLVRNGQLEFNLGGWCMNDEATPIYWQEIDQMTQGAQFLLNELGATPTVGWHVDPFGHSSSTPSMWQQMGMNAFGFWRIHYALADELAKTKSMEFVWRSSSSLGEQNDIWCHIMPYAYCTPGECGYDGGLIVNTDSSLPTYGVNIQSQAQQFITMARSRLQFVRHSHVLIPFGCDFAHQNAFRSFVQMDKLIDYVNSHPEYNATVQYSFFSDYVKAVHEANVTFPVRTPADGDFFPYADHPHAYWTGYYTSRPALKKFVRTRAVISRSAEFLYSSSVITGIAFNTSAALYNLDIMRQALGVSQHHDAVSGTEKQHVAEDYHVQLQQGTDMCTQVINELSPNLAALPGESGPSLTVDSSALAILKPGQFLPVVIYNTLGWARSDFVSVLTNRTDLSVVDENGDAVPSQVNPVGKFSLDYDSKTATQRLFFQPTVAPFGSSTYFVKVDQKAPTGTVFEGTRSINNTFYSLSFDASGRFSSLSNLVTGSKRDINQEYYQYVSAWQSEQNSGAYVFRPEQGNRMNVGSDNDGSHPFVTSTWQFIEPFSPSAKLVAFTTPRGDPQYTDTFASSVKFLYPQNLTITVDRVDGPHPSPDPWGQSVSVDFLPVDTSVPFIQGFQVGSEVVGTSASPFKVITYSFPQPFKQEPPRVIVSMRGSVDDGDQVFLPSVISVSAHSFTVNCTINSGSSWQQTVFLDWIAWDTAAAHNIPDTFSEGLATFTVKSDGPLAQFTVDLKPSLPVIDPIIIAGVASEKHTVAHTATMGTSSTFGINVACTDCEFKAGDQIRVSWLAFVRPFFGAPVTTSPLQNTNTILGPYVKEVWQPFRDQYAIQTLRLYQGTDESTAHVEVVNDIGPLDPGRELVTRFRTNFATATSSTTGKFYTDDNGLEMLERTYNTVSDEPIAGNYFPASQRAILKENDNSLQFTIVMTSSHGCGSNSSGHIELMLHRRCLRDDGYGVGEVLNEADHVDSKLALLLDSPDNSSRIHRRLALQLEFPNTLLFATPVDSIQSYTSSFATKSTFMSNILPPNVHLLSFFAQEGTSSYILRLQHLYPVGEHPTLSRPVDIDLSTLFAKHVPTQIEETTLSANKPLAAVQHPVWMTENGVSAPRVVPDALPVITLNPREIRTFLVRF